MYRQSLLNVREHSVPPDACGAAPIYRLCHKESVQERHQPPRRAPQQLRVLLPLDPPGGISLGAMGCVRAAVTIGFNSSVIILKKRASIACLDAGHSIPIQRGLVPMLLLSSPRLQSSKWGHTSGSIPLGTSTLVVEGKQGSGSFGNHGVSGWRKAI